MREHLSGERISPKSKKELFGHIREAIIDRSLEKHNELRSQKAKAEIVMLTVDDLAKAKRHKTVGKR